MDNIANFCIGVMFFNFTIHVTGTTIRLAVENAIKAFDRLAFPLTNLVWVHLKMDGKVLKGSVVT